MLKVDTYLKQTDKKGIGLFACNKIPKGTVVHIDEDIFDKTYTRDFNGATNTLQEGLRTIGVEYTEYTPAEMSASALNLIQGRLNAVPRLRVSAVMETGSSPHL